MKVVNVPVETFEECKEICDLFSSDEGIEYFVTMKEVNDKKYYRPCSYLYVKRWDNEFGYKVVKG